MAITAAQVKELRERTGLAMMKCKKALQEADGDIDAAVEALRKAGEAAADKKSGRSTNCGSLGLAVEDGKALLVLVACETDFVSGNGEFKDFVASVAKAGLAAGATDADSLEAAALDGSTVKEALVGMIQKLGENMKIDAIETIAGDKVVGYNHGGKVAAVVAGAGDDEAALRSIAIHIASANPAPCALSRDDVDAEVLQKEKEIIEALPDVAAKPEHIRPKIVEGKLGRFFKENVLLEQEMLIDADDGENVEKYAKAKGLTLSGFLRLKIG